jgi:hypothetical protein
METENAASGVMPIGQRMLETIRKNDVTTTPGALEAPKFHDDAAASLVWQDYNLAKNFVENNAWLLEWQETDILYQSPVPNRFTRVEEGRPARVSRFLVAKLSRVLARAVKRGIFAEQYPFFLRPTGKTTQEQIEAWTALIGKLLKRMKFQYHCGLLIDCQVLQGTGLGKYGWEERKVTKAKRRRKGQPIKADMPSGTPEQVPTAESDEYETVREVVTESWPFFEYRRLGTTLLDPKWSTPDMPDESAGYVCDIDFVNFSDLARMRQLECYKNIPDEATLKTFFFHKQGGDAPTASNVDDSMSANGSMVAHAEGRNKSTSADPLKTPMMMIEEWDTQTVKTILCYEGRTLLIRNEQHDFNSSAHVAATWWPIDNNGYGMGIGRLNGPDQRINQGVINASLKMIAYPFNAPLLYQRGENAPTQNIIARLGGMFGVDVPAGGDVRKAMAFMDMPKIPDDAWKMLAYSQETAEDTSGANKQFQQGNLGGPGSSAGRTATGAGRIAAMSDQNVADPIDSVSQGVIIPVIQFLVDQVRLRMPLEEIRDILSEKHAKVIQKAIDEDNFLEATFEVDVLAGQKLAARAGIQQLIPFLLQIVQQPQLLQFLHQKGWTVDFKVMLDLLLQVSELTQQPDIFRLLTDDEKKALQQTLNPEAQKLRSAVEIEKVKGMNKQAEIEKQSEADLGLKAAETVMAHASNGIPLSRAAGLVERAEDVDALKNGLPDQTQ